MMNKFSKLSLGAVVLSLTSSAYAFCPPGPNGGLLQNRKLEALFIAQANASKIHRALDNVMDATGPYGTGDTAFDQGIDYVLSLQFGTGPGQMDIWIDDKHSTDAASFKANWFSATQAFKYRKRTEDDWTIANYEEDASCLRKITAFSTGKNFNITNTPIPASNPPSNAANYATDRFTVTLQELPPNLGHDCNFNFRIVSLRQITESRFPLPPVPVPAAPVNGSLVSFGVVSSPIDPFVIADPVKAVLPLTPCL
jgi:hypothetical protein